MSSSNAFHAIFHTTHGSCPRRALPCALSGKALLLAEIAARTNGRTKGAAGTDEQKEGRREDSREEGRTKESKITIF